MKIEYIRNLNASHMVMEQKAELKDWETKMVSQNHIEGFLFAESVNEDNTKRLWYDITGKQALEVLLETSELNYELLCMLVERIYKAVEKLQSFLLKEDDILLNSECIFIDHKTGEIFFCYYPGNEQSLPMAFARLTEYLLTRLNHKDEKAVKLAYDLYEQTRTDGYSLSAIRCMICTPYPKETEITEETGDEVQYEYSAGKKEGLDAPKDRIEKRSAQRILKSKKENELQMKNSVLKEESSKGLFGYLQGMQKLLKTILPVALVERLKKSQNAKILEQEELVFEPEEEIEKPVHPTVLLSELSSEPVGILRYEGDKVQDLKIDRVPFLIGSDETCDGYIKSDTVSRKHARITKAGDIYFIEDLNSSNGTYVGGELLNYRVKMSLQKNESIIFADEKFIFI